MYDKLLASQLPNVQDSLDCWLPPDTGLRQKIDEVSRRHPHGFNASIHTSTKNTEGTELMDMMEDKLQRVSGFKFAPWNSISCPSSFLLHLHYASS